MKYVLFDWAPARSFLLTPADRATRECLRAGSCDGGQSGQPATAGAARSEHLDLWTWHELLASWGIQGFLHEASRSER